MWPTILLSIEARRSPCGASMRFGVSRDTQGHVNGRGNGWGNGRLPAAPEGARWSLNGSAAAGRAATGSKQTVLMAGIFSIIATESSTRTRLAQRRTTSARQVASQRYTMLMRRSPLRLTPTHQNGPANRSTTRGASTIWCDARRSRKRSTPGTQALVNRRNDHRKSGEWSACPYLLRHMQLASRRPSPHRTLLARYFFLGSFIGRSWLGGYPACRTTWATIAVANFRSSSRVDSSVS